MPVPCRELEISTSLISECLAQLAGGKWEIRRQLILQLQMACIGPRCMNLPPSCHKGIGAVTNLGSKKLVDMQQGHQHIDALWDSSPPQKKEANIQSGPSMIKPNLSNSLWLGWGTGASLSSPKPKHKLFSSWRHNAPQPSAFSRFGGPKNSQANSSRPKNRTSSAFAQDLPILPARLLSNAGGCHSVRPRGLGAARASKYEQVSFTGLKGIAQPWFGQSPHNDHLL